MTTADDRRRYQSLMLVPRHLAPTNDEWPRIMVIQAEISALDNRNKQKLDV